MLRKMTTDEAFERFCEVSGAEPSSHIAFSLIGGHQPAGLLRSQIPPRGGLRRRRMRVFRRACWSLGHARGDL